MQLSRKIFDEMKDFEPIVRVFRFYVVLRRFSYIDPLIYSTSKELIKHVIDEALNKEYESYKSSSSQKRVVIQSGSGEEKVVEAPCLVVAKPEEIPKTFFLIYRSIIHKIESADEYCISPLNEDGALIEPQKDIIQKFIEKINYNVEYAKLLAALALSGE